MIRIKTSQDVVYEKTCKANTRKVNIFKNKKKRLSPTKITKLPPIKITGETKHPYYIRDSKTNKAIINPVFKKPIEVKPIETKKQIDDITYVPKKENINRLRDVIDTLFLDGECGILRNNEIIINDEEVEYAEEQPYKFSESTGKYVGSGLSVLGVKNLVMKGDYIFHCNRCDTDMAYTEYKGRKNFNFQVKDDLRLNIGYCNSCSTKRIGEWISENRDKANETQNKWRSENRDTINKYIKERRINDPLFKMTMNLRSRTKEAFKRSRWNKTSTNKELLGCSFETAHKHLEIQFAKGMSWDNYGKWHIDHIIPLCAANTEEELKTLCHHKNLQPLWAFDNISKNGKYNEKEKAEMLKFIINCK